MVYIFEGFLVKPELSFSSLSIVDQGPIKYLKTVFVTIFNQFFHIKGALFFQMFSGYAKTNQVFEFVLLTKDGQFPF